MQNDLTERVSRFIAQRGMSRPGHRIGVAVSGGADSVGLLLLLEELRHKLGIRLAVLHFNHRLRGAQSDSEQEFVAALARQKEIECFIGAEDVAEQARLRGWNLEDAGRRLRYAFFAQAASAHDIDRVAVAHTADDQAETVLARLMRGTGPAGLAAIYPVKGRIIRPLLEIRRAELRDYLLGRGQDWREDPSNLDTTRLRAKLRLNVLPLIETQVQPAIVTHLGRLAQLAREDEAFWAAFVAERLRSLVRSDSPGPRTEPIADTGHVQARSAPGHHHDAKDANNSAVERPGAGPGPRSPDRRLGIRCADLLAPLPFSCTGAPAAETATHGAAPKRAAGSDPAKALTRRLIRAIIEDLRGDCRQVTAQHVEQVLQLASSVSGGGRAELPGIAVERSFESLWFEQFGHAPDRTASAKSSAVRLGPLRRSLNPSNASPYSVEVELGSTGDVTVVSISEINRRFLLKVIDWPAGERETVTDTYVLDRDLLFPPLVFRNWRPGDSFRPCGRRSARKIKHFLRAGKISVRDRAGWPVLTSRDSLIWTRGMPVAAQFAPGAETHRAVVIAEQDF